MVRRHALLAVCLALGLVASQEHSGGSVAGDAAGEVRAGPAIGHLLERCLCCPQ